MTEKHDQTSHDELKLFRCPTCGHYQPFVCPSCGQQASDTTLIRVGDSAQCTQCNTHVSQMTCACGQVTYLTPEILDDPTGSKYTAGDAQQISRYQEILERNKNAVVKQKEDVWANEALVAEFKAILADAESLLDSLPKKYPFFNPKNLQAMIADTKSQIARTYDTLRNSQEAISYYELAIQTYEELGKREKVQECSDNIKRIHLRDEGIIDDELKRLQAKLDTQFAALPKGSLHYIELMIELSSLYLQASDYFEAEKILQAAEKELKSLKLLDANGKYLPDLLEEGTLGNSSVTIGETTYQLYQYVVHFQVLTLHVRLYTNLASVYREDLQEAIKYLSLAKQKAGPGQLTSLAEMQLASYILKQVIKTSTTKGHEPYISAIADALLQGAHALEAEARRLKVLEGITAALLLEAEILMAVQRDDEAIAVLSKAQCELQGRFDHDTGVRVLAKLAEAHAHKQQWEEVSLRCEEGIKLVETYRYKVTGQYMQSSYLTSRIGLYSWGVKAAYELEDYELMLKRAELSKCRSVLRYLPSTLDSTEEQQHTLREFQHVSEQIATASTESALLEELQRKRRTLWDLLTVQRFQARTGQSLPEFSLTAIQATLAKDEAIIYYYWLDMCTLLIVLIDQQHDVSVLRSLSGEQQAKLKAFANLVLTFSPDQNKEQDDKELNEIENFSSLLLPEKATAFLEGKQRLIFSPHRLLHALPFHALQWDNAFLIQHFAVTYAPNLSSLLSRYTPAKQQSILALGVREYDVPDKQLPSLKKAEQEVEDLKHIAEAHSIPIVTLKGQEAQKEQLHQLHLAGTLTKCTCLHFAIHGSSINSDTPMESYLCLRDALLDGLEIANWQLNADLVVLSACCSGQRPISGRRMDELPGDELFGLQSAFFTAGAKRILSCLWPVEDFVAPQITKSFHLHVADGKPPERALQAALKDYLNKAKVRTRRVYYWAPFFLSAMGRSEITNS